MEEIGKRIMEVLERETCIDQRYLDGSIGYEIYVSYNERIWDDQLVRISRSHYTLMVLDGILSEWEDAERFNEIDRIEDILKKNLDDYDENVDDIIDWIADNVYWYLPDKVIEQEVKVVVALDTGDANTDFSECNYLNYYSDTNEPEGSEISDTSPIRFVAESQGRFRELQEAIRKMRNAFNDGITDKGMEVKYSPFTESMIEELENATSSMNTFCFLLRMKLKDFCLLREMMRKGEGELVISHRTMCGLYDMWGGGGSMLGVDLEKEISIPMTKMFDAWIDCKGCKANGHGYDLDEVYGLCDSAWDYGTFELKEVG